MQDAVERKKKAWQDYKASGKDRSTREIKKKEYKLQKHQAKVLIKIKSEKAENERNESFNFRENTKHFWREVNVSRGCMLTRRMKGVLSNDGKILTEQPHVLQ